MKVISIPNRLACRPVCRSAAAALSIWLFSAAAAMAGPLPDWMTVKPNVKLLMLALDAGVGEANGALNFNGHHDGSHKIVVPQGWTVVVRMKNSDARVPHSATDSSKWRLWLTFSKSRLMPFYRRRAVSLRADGEGVLEIDVRRSTLHFPASAEAILERRHELLSPASVRFYTEVLAEYERRFEAGDNVDVSMSGEGYWLALLAGLAQYQQDRGLEAGNVYLSWVSRGIAAGKVDPGLKPLLDDPADLRARIAPRLAALSQAIRERDVSHFTDMPIAFNPTPFHPALAPISLTTLAVKDSDERLTVSNLDGHHRLFIMKLLDIESCEMMTIWDPEWLGRIRAVQAVANYEVRMYQHLAGVDVDDPILTESPASEARAV